MIVAEWHLANCHAIFLQSGQKKVSKQWKYESKIPVEIALASFRKLENNTHALETPLKAILEIIGEVAEWSKALHC